MALTVGVDTYILLADADIYFAARYGSEAWTVLDDPTKEVLLKSAARALDVYSDSWIGSPSDEDQDMIFPRDDEEIPENIKIAQCEIAYSMLSGGSIVAGDDAAMTKFKVDVIEFNFAATSSMSENTLYNDYTQRLLRPYIAYSIGAKRLTRVG